MSTTLYLLAIACCLCAGVASLAEADDLVRGLVIGGVAFGMAGVGE